jgi:hypothetical protein
MNPPTKSEVIDLLTRVQKQQSKLLELQTAYNAALSNTAQAQTSISEIGAPALDDDDGIARLATAEKKLSLSQTAVADFTNQIDTVCREIVPVLDVGGQIVRRLLSLARAEKCSEIAAAVRRFCRSGDEAQTVAATTSAARVWSGQIDAYAEIYKQPEPYSAQAFLAALESIEAPLSESLRTQPSLGKFLNWSAT